MKRGYIMQSRIAKKYEVKFLNDIKRLDKDYNEGWFHFDEKDIELCNLLIDYFNYKYQNNYTFFFHENTYNIFYKKVK